MHASDWLTTGAVKNDHDEEIVQGAVEDDDARRGLEDGIQDAIDDGDNEGVESLSALLHETNRRRRVRELIRERKANAIDERIQEPEHMASRHSEVDWLRDHVVVASVSNESGGIGR